MKIKYQLVFVVLLTVFGFSVTEYAIQNLIVLPSFQRLEDVKARTNLARCVSAIENEISHLDQVCNDWAAWSDTYEFMRTGSGDYIEANLVDTSFTDNNLNLICLVAGDNQVAWSRTVDLESMQDFPLRMFPADRFSADSPVLAHTRYREGDTQGVAGIVITEKGPMLMASRPILTSNREGPSRGTLIMGTLLTERYVNRLSRQVQVPFRVNPAAGGAAAPAGQDAVLERKGNDSILARASVPGLNRKTALDVIASLDTSILAMGRKTTRYAMYSGIVSGLGILLFLMFFMQRRVLKPLSGLAGKLTEIGDRGDMGARLAMKRRDEIGVVAREFDRMMGQLEEKSVELVGANEALRLDQERRLEVEKALRKSENYYRRVLFGMHEEIYIIGPDHRITDVNKPHMDSVGRGREEILGQPCHRVFHGREGSCPENCGTCVLDEVMETGAARQYRHQHRRADGSAVWVDVLMSPLRDEDGRFLGVISAMRDVTQEVEMEKTVRQKSKMEAIGTLAGGIAHDFNNMLMSILLNVEFAMGYAEETGPVRTPLGIAYDSACQARDLVDQILTFSRQKEQRPRPILVAPIIGETLRMIRSTTLANIEIESRIQSPGARIMGTPSLVYQVVVNLCTNAVTAMGSGGGTLTLAMDTVDNMGGMVVSPDAGKDRACLMLSVSDTGKGIEEENLERIFEPFYTTLSAGMGTGMGLAVVHGIVTSLDGGISVESHPGDGTTFRVCIPLYEGEDVPEPRESSPRFPQETDSLPGTAGRILVVDDNHLLLDSLERVLAKQGFAVTVAGEPRDALELFRKDPDAYSLLLTDLDMPHMSGTELAEKMRLIREGLPVVFLTGYAKGLDEIEGIKNALVVRKPLKTIEIASIVLMALQPGGSGRGR